MLIIEMLGESGTPARSKMNITAMHTNYMLEKLGIMPKIVVIGTKAKITIFFFGGNIRDISTIILGKGNSKTILISHPSTPSIKLYNYIGINVGPSAKDDYFSLFIRERDGVSVSVCVTTT